MIDPFAELVQFDEALSDLDQRVRGRMARVVNADAHMVTVEVPGPNGWDGPLGPYPATVTDLAARALGVLLPLRGGQALFLAIGGGSVVSPAGGGSMAAMGGALAALGANLAQMPVTPPDDTTGEGE